MGTSTLIIGGGLAGLSAGWHLGREATVLEASSTVGGLCRSYRREGYTFDISGHLLHFRRPDIRRRRGVSMFLGSPDHVALRLRRWRLSVRQTVLVSYATAVLLGAAGVAVMLLDVRGALGVLGALGALGLGFAWWLKRIDMGL